MILLINKYHRVNGGETASAEKVEKENEVECYREAFKKASQYEANYYADATVIDFAVSVYDPKKCAVVKHSEYFSPIVEREEVAD